MRTVLSSALAAIIIASAAPAIANTGIETVEVRVPHGDLNLATEAGRAALERRIDRMVREACEVADPLGRAAPKTDKTCVRDAKRTALAQIDRTGESRMAMGAE